MATSSLAKSSRRSFHGHRKTHSMNSHALRRSFAFAAALGSLPSVALAQGPSQVGAWDPPFPLPLIAIHSAVLPTGKVLLFSAEHGVPGIHGWILDPTTLALTNVAPPPGWNPDCAGHSFLSDGRLLVAGGTLSFTPLTGPKLAFLFNPWTEQWVQVEDMRKGRWYPTNVTLQDGTVLTMAGLSDVAATNNPDIELWDPASATNWQLLGQRQLPYYPLLHLMPSGLVFMAGPAALTETYNPSSNTWTPIDTTNAPGRYEACSVMLPPTLTRVMLVGGYNGGSGQPTNSAEIIDLAAGSPQWATTAHMAFARMEHNAVLLPNGKVLVIGGRSDNDATPTPVLTPEVFDPLTASWTSVAPHSIPRRYHSTSVLLPDGRVLAAGGDFQPTGEIYSPAYLFAGSRPAIVSSPSTIGYGSSFTVQFSGTTATHSAVLVSLSCVTHSNNMSQRYVPLGTVNSSGGSVSITAPSDPRMAPPGFYMLFIVSNSGVPSVSKMIRILEAANGQAFCFGDGSATPCPCGNASPIGNDEGCLHSLGLGGSLFASGIASISADTLILSASRLPNTLALYLQGTTRLNGGLGATFGDGLRCAGGSIMRLGMRTGSFSQCTGPGNAPMSIKGQVITPGATRTYQVWYRDPAAYCTPDPFNLTNAWEITWSP